jgi:hypothetical protein
MASGMKHPGFQGDLISLINKHGLDNLTNTPDFILAGMLVEQLEAYRITKEACERWHDMPPQRINADLPPVSDEARTLVAPAWAHNDGLPCGDECFKPGHDH